MDQLSCPSEGPWDQGSNQGEEGGKILDQMAATVQVVESPLVKMGGYLWDHVDLCTLASDVYFRRSHPCEAVGPSVRRAETPRGDLWPSPIRPYDPCRVEDRLRSIRGEGLRLLLFPSTHVDL